MLAMMRVPCSKHHGPHQEAEGLGQMASDKIQADPSVETIGLWAEQQVALSPNLGITYSRFPRPACIARTATRGLLLLGQNELPARETGLAMPISSIRGLR
jgi:hypothetical protein